MTSPVATVPPVRIQHASQFQDKTVYFHNLNTMTCLIILGSQCGKLSNEVHIFTIN